MIREAARGRGERGLGKFDSNPSLVGAHPVPVSIGGGGAGRQVEQVEKEACCCAAIERQTPRALLSLGGGSKLEGCGPRVNAFLLYYATQLEPNPPSLPPSSNRLGKFRSTVIQTRVQPKKNAPRDACARNVYTCMYVYAYRSFFDPFFFSKMRQRFFPPSKLSFLPPFLLSFPRSRKF